MRPGGDCGAAQRAGAWEGVRRAVAARVSSESGLGAEPCNHQPTTREFLPFLDMHPGVTALGASENIASTRNLALSVAHTLLGCAFLWGVARCPVGGATAIRLVAFLYCPRSDIFNTYVATARPDRGTGRTAGWGSVVLSTAVILSTVQQN